MGDNATVLYLYAGSYSLSKVVAQSQSRRDLWRSAAWGNRGAQASLPPRAYLCAAVQHPTLSGPQPPILTAAR